MDSLFADEAFERRPRLVFPGAVWLPGYLDERAQEWIIARWSQWQAGPVPAHSTRIGGHPMSVKTIGLGWHWRPGAYDRRARDVNNETVLPFPDWMTRLGRQVIDSAAGAVARDDDQPGSAASVWGLTASDYEPDVALVNYYDETAKMGMHQDKDEYDPAPVVSLSLGDTCIFRFGNSESRNRPYEDIRLASGDAFVFGGPARFAYHGVTKILPGTAPEHGRLSHLGGGRINITMRTTGRD